MKVIHKHALKPGVSQVWMPRSSRILDVHTQYGVPTIWVETDPDKAGSPREFVTVPTGGEVPPEGRYLGTTHSVEGTLVFHIYEVT